MELRQLEYFAAVAEHGSFTAAAAHVHTTQPNISAQIRTLERELGSVLFDRTGRTVRLTEAGRAALPAARDTLDAAARVAAAVAEVDGLLRGSLSIGMVEGCTIAPLFAVVRTPAWDKDAHPIMREAFDELVAALGDHATAIDLVSAADAIEAQRIVQLAENASYYGPLFKRAPELISPGLTKRLEAGLAIPAHQYVDAIRSRAALSEVIDELTTNFSAILTLAAPGPAPKLDEGVTGSPVFNGLWTYYGCPCVSIPVMEADGLPLGVQLVGSRGDDGRLLRSARWLSRHIAGLAA